MAEQKSSRASRPVEQAIISVQLLSERELAAALGFKQVSWKFREFIDQADIRPVPGRAGFYDPKLVRARLDAMQNNLDETSADFSLTQQRRKRLGKA